MPAADITEVKVSIADGLKAREEYAPPKKAEVTITAAVAEGQDGAVALAYITTLAKAKVAEILGQNPAATGNAPGALATSPQQAAADVAQTQRRPRRTQAQIAADNAAAGPSEPAADSSVTSGETVADASTGEHEAQDTTGSAETGDDWASPTDVVISDAELNAACSAAAQKLGSPDKVRGLIGKFTGPGGSLKSLPAGQRKDFLAQLNALS